MIEYCTVNVKVIPLNINQDISVNIKHSTRYHHNQFYSIWVGIHALVKTTVEPVDVTVWNMVDFLIVVNFVNRYIVTIVVVVVKD